MEYIIAFSSFLLASIAYKPQVVGAKMAISGYQPILMWGFSNEFINKTIEVFYFIAFLSMVLWAFLNIIWWITILLFLGAVLLSDFIVFDKTIVFFTKISLLTMSSVSVLAVYVWIQ